MAEANRSGSCGAPRAGLRNLGAFFLGKMLIGATPVSYTHLDVYKRQHQHAEQMSDEGFSRIIDDAGRIHQQNFNDFYNYLEGL